MTDGSSWICFRPCKRQVAMHQWQAEDTLHSGGARLSRLVVGDAVSITIDDGEPARRTDDVPTVRQRTGGKIGP